MIDSQCDRCSIKKYSGYSSVSITTANLSGGRAQWKAGITLLADNAFTINNIVLEGKEKEEIFKPVASLFGPLNKSELF